MTGPEVLIKSLIKAFGIQIDQAELSARVVQIVNEGPPLIVNTHARIAALETRLESIDKKLTVIVEALKNGGHITGTIN